jgi:hypothetical protein
MAQNTTVAVPAKTWTLLTNSDVTHITFQAGDRIAVKATAGAVAPTDLSGAIWYPVGSGEMNTALADLWSGVTGGNRVYAWSFTGTGVVVSHA